MIVDDFFSVRKSIKKSLLELGFYGEIIESEFIRESELLKNIPFLMLSSVNDKAKILNAINVGVSNYLLKPWENDVLESKMISCWLKHYPASNKK